MDLYMIASINRAGQSVGFRILDKDANKTMDVTNAQVIGVLKQGVKIKNVELKGGKVVGSNGDISRYAVISDGLLVGVSPIVVLKQLGEVGYIVSDHAGKVLNLKTAEVLKYASKFGIANGKISSRDNKQFISAIHGSYDYIALNTQDTSIKAPQLESKASNKTQVPVQSTQVPVASTQVPVASTQVPVASTQVPVASTQVPVDNSIKSPFTEHQLGVLRQYYVDYNIGEERIKAELEDISSRLKDPYSKTKLLNEIIALSRSSLILGSLVGNKCAGYLIQFISVGLPLPISLVSLASHNLSKDTSNSTKKIIKGMDKTIDYIFSNSDNTLLIAAKHYINSFYTHGILDSLSPNSVDDNKEYIENWLHTYNFRYNTLRAIVGYIDKVSSAKRIHTLNNILDAFLRERLRRKYSDAYRKDMYLLALEFNRQNDAIQSLGLVELFAFNREYYSSEPSVPYQFDCGVYNRCLSGGVYDSTTWNELPMALKNRDKTIEEMYSTQLKLYISSTVHTFIKWACDRIVEALEFEKEQLMQEQLRQEQLRQEKLRQEQLRQEQLRQEKLRQEQLRQEQLRREQLRQEQLRQEQLRQEQLRQEQLRQEQLRQEQLRQEQSQEQSQNDDSIKTKTIEQMILDGDDLDRVDKNSLYRAAKKSAVGIDVSYSMKIADDMEKRGLLYKDMSPRQKYRLDMAIKELISHVRKDGIAPVINPSYSLSDRKDIKDKVDRLVKMTNTPDMERVLKIEPNTLKICDTILKYNKASERQLEHINKAIEILDKHKA